jgi:hypothetical protein
MPNLIKPGEARVITKNGEVFVNISLELTVKLDGSNISVAALSGAGSESPSATSPKDKVSWQIPDFTSSKIEFGK